MGTGICQHVARDQVQNALRVVRTYPGAQGQAPGVGEGQTRSAAEAQVPASVPYVVTDGPLACLAQGFCLEIGRTSRHNQDSGRLGTCLLAKKGPLGYVYALQESDWKAETPQSS